MFSQDPLFENVTLDALVDAFRDDPFYIALTPDVHISEDTRRALMREYFAYALREGKSYGIVEIEATTRAGAAIWLLPQTKGVAHQLQQTKNAALKKFLSPRGFQNYVNMIEAMAPHAERIVPRDSWYLSIIGVSPTLQGRGVGKQLLASTLAQGDAQQVPCFLETFTPRTFPFYESVGFRIVAQHDEAVTGRAYWIMVREATNPSR